MINVLQEYIRTEHPFLSIEATLRLSNHPANPEICQRREPEIRLPHQVGCRLLQTGQLENATMSPATMSGSIMVRELKSSNLYQPLLMSIIVDDSVWQTGQVVDIPGVSGSTLRPFVSEPL